MSEVAFIVMTCKNNNEKAKREIEQIVQNVRNSKMWKLEKVTILPEEQG